MDDQPATSLDPLWTDEDVAAYLNVAVATVQKWAKTGKIPVRKVGSLNRFDRKEIERWTREGNASDDDDQERASA